MISGSMAFAHEMLETEKQLEKMGHTVSLPYETQSHVEDPGLVDNLDANLKYLEGKDILRKSFQLVEGSDAILIINHKRRDIEGYMGVSTLMEAAIAHYLHKKIFILNDIPDQKTHRWAHEVSLMDPTFIQRDLSKIH